MQLKMLIKIGRLKLPFPSACVLDFSKYQKNFASLIKTFVLEINVA